MRGNVLEQPIKARNGFCLIQKFLCVGVGVNFLGNLLQGALQVAAPFFGDLVNQVFNGGKVVAAEVLQHIVQRSNVVHVNMQVGIFLQSLQEGLHFPKGNDALIHSAGVKLAQTGNDLLKGDLRECLNELAAGKAFECEQFLPQTCKRFAIAVLQEFAVNIGYQSWNIDDQVELVVHLFELDVFVQLFCGAADVRQVALYLNGNVNVLVFVVA